MIGALVEMDQAGRIVAVYVIASSEREEWLVKGALARITSPRSWSWISRLFRRGRMMR
jgi:hypothetical protein